MTAKDERLNVFFVFFSALKSAFKPPQHIAPLMMMVKRGLSSEEIDRFSSVKIVELKPFVYNVQLNREKKLNALNKEMWL